MKAIPVAIALGCAATLAGAGEVRTEPLKYACGDRIMVGYLAYPAGLTNKQPGVLVVHEWYGLNAFARRRAEQLAALGYVALAADMYGDGHVARDTQEAGALATALKSDRAELRRRAQAALAALRGFRWTDPQRVAAIGFCFGGTTVLELARSGATLAGVVCFHGGLDALHPEDARNIKASVLVCHGANDPFSPPKDVAAFQDEMRQAGVDWQMALYGGAVHSFTNPEAGNDPSKGAAYNAVADRRSWELMQGFLRERLAKTE